jgi:hypothetical protein
MFEIKAVELNEIYSYMQIFLYNELFMRKSLKLYLIFM